MTRLRGLGTVIKVSSGGLAKPVVRVRWDDGTLADYASGMSISRDAVSRIVHPHLDESVGPYTALARPLTHLYMYVACVRIPTTDFC